MRSLTISIGGNYTTQRMNKVDVGDSDYNNLSMPTQCLQNCTIFSSSEGNRYLLWDVTNFDHFLSRNLRAAGVVRKESIVVIELPCCGNNFEAAG